VGGGHGGGLKGREGFGDGGMGRLHVALVVFFCSKVGHRRKILIERSGERERVYRNVVVVSRSDFYRMEQH